MRSMRTASLLRLLLPRLYVAVNPSMGFLEALCNQVPICGRILPV